MQMPEDPTKIAKWIIEKLKDRSDVYAGRNEMMNFDRRLLLQNYRREIAGTASIQSAEPRNALRLSLDIMTRRELKFQAIISDQSAAQQDDINNLERFAQGLWRATGRQWRKMGNRAFLRDLDWYTLMGGYGIAPLVQDTPKGTKFSARVLDPMNVYPDYDENGLCWVAHSYRTTMKHVRPRMMEKSGWDADSIAQKSDADEIKVINCFWLDPIDGDESKMGVWNAVLVEEAVVKPATYEKQFSSVESAIIIGPSTGNPFNTPLTDDDGLGWRGGVGPSASATEWESLFSPARRSYADLDSYLSYAAEITRRNALGRYIQRTKNGAPVVSVPQFRNMELGSMKSGEDIVPVPPPQSPTERSELLAFMLGSIQRSTLAFTAYGSTGGLELSGVTIDSLNTATQSVLAPFIQASEFAISEMIMSYVDQFRAGKFKAVSLEVRDRAGENVAERWFLKDYKRTEIPESALLNVTQSLALPDTTLARLNAARTAFGDNRQIISGQNVDEFLLPDLVPDSQLNREQISQDKIQNSPQADAFSTVEGLRRMAEDAQSRGDRDMTMVAMTLMQQTMAQFQQQVAGAEQRVAGIDAQRQAQAGAGITEPSPDQSPPEASGVRPEAVDQDRLAGNNAIRSVIERRANSVNGRP